MERQIVRSIEIIVMVGFFVYAVQAVIPAVARLVEFQGERDPEYIPSRQDPIVIIKAIPIHNDRNPQRHALWLVLVIETLDRTE